MPLDPDDVAARSAAIHRSGPRAGQSVGTRLDRFSSALTRTVWTHSPGSSIGYFLLDFPMVLTCAKMAIGDKYRHMGRTSHLIPAPTQRGTLPGGSRLSMTAKAHAKKHIWDATITTAAEKAKCQPGGATTQEVCRIGNGNVQAGMSNDITRNPGTNSGGH